MFKPGDRVRRRSMPLDGMPLFSEWTEKSCFKKQLTLVKEPLTTGLLYYYPNYFELVAPNRVGVILDLANPIEATLDTFVRQLRAQAEDRREGDETLALLKERLT